MPLVLRTLAQRLTGAAVVLAGAWLLAGCAAERPQPTPLEVVKPQIAGRLVWQLKLGSGIGFPLAATVRDGHVFVGADDGSVLAVETVSGRVRWRVQAGDRLSAGVGSDGRHMAVVTQGQELVVFEGEKLAWRARLPGRVVTAPLVAGERVFVLGLDRSVRAFASASAPARNPPVASRIAPDSTNPASRNAMSELTGPARPRR